MDQKRFEKDRGALGATCLISTFQLVKNQQFGTTK